MIVYMVYTPSLDEAIMLLSILERDLPIISSYIEGKIFPPCEVMEIKFKMEEGIKNVDKATEIIGNYEHSFYSS